MKKSLYKYFTDEEKSDVIASYESGVSSRKLGKKYSCANNTILALLRRNGIEINRHRSMSCSNKGRSSARKGARLSEETKKKLSLARKGKSTTTGMKHSEESKAKMSARKKEFLQNNPGYMQYVANFRRMQTEDERRFKGLIRTRQKNLIRRLLGLIS